MATSGDKKIGIVIPTRWEAKQLFQLIPFRRSSSGLYEGSTEGRSLLLSISGVGREAARRASDALCAAGARELISMGFCGALLPSLKVGDLVTHRIITVDSAVRTPEERQALTGRANAIAVDMETQAVVESGTRRGVPIRILRVVSDTFEEDLSPLFGKEEAFSVWRIGLRLLNPKAWPLALRLRANSVVAQKRLAEALTQAVASPT